MTRWVVLGCAAVAAVGLLYRLTAAPEDDRDAARARVRASIGSTQPAGAAPAEAPAPPAVRELEKRLLRDDTLAPPAPTATDEEQKAYDSAVRAIIRGEDPLLKEEHAGLAAATGRENPTETLQQRLAERRRAAFEHLHKRREAVLKARRERMQRTLDEQAARVNRVRNPNRPKPEPLFPTPKLGPAVTGIEPKEPAPEQEPAPAQK
jgi:hypothetical protein